MNVNLYYIHGISRIDTPYYATPTVSASKAKQEEYFLSKLVKSVELSFYPPHYQNVIKFDSEDLDFNTNVNYLSLEFNDRIYYYFIDDIEYVSESIIRIYITMDVIQTYMFDIEITNGIVERKFINRWIKNENNYLINRDYIRENLSDGEMYYYSREVLNEDTTKWVLCIQLVSMYHSEYITIKIKYDLQMPVLNSVNTGYELMFTYMSSWNTIGREWSDVSSSTDARALNYENRQNVEMTMDAIDKMAYYCQKNEISDIYICPFNFIKGNTFSGNTLVIADNDISKADYLANVVPMIVPYIAPSVNERSLFLVPNPKISGGHASNEQELYINTETVSKSFSFIRNTHTGTYYSSSYMSMLLDENYIELTFGTVATYTTIPLYKLDKPSLSLHYGFNPIDGSRLYWITRTASEKDIFKTCVIDMNVLHYDIKNNAWQNYVAANRGRWAAAIANTAISVFTKGAYSRTKGKFISEDMNTIINNPKNYDKRYKKSSRLKKKYQEELSSLSRKSQLNVDEETSMYGSASGDIVGQAFKDFNVMATPPTPRQCSNVSDAIGIGALIIYEIKRCIDYEQVSNYYHRNGYLVNKYINYQANIFEHVQNRYYFNMLKMQLPEVHLRNVIEDDATIDAIKERLITGVRLWNVRNYDNIGDFQYDNVENDFLEGGN